MPDLTPEIVDAVLAACTEGAEEAAEAFGRALDAEMAVSVGQGGTLEMEKLPEGLDGPGLAVVFTIGSVGALVLLPESCGLVPEWCANPDATGQSKLTTLAQELGMIVLPEEFMPEGSETVRLDNLAEALRRSGVGDGAGVVSLEMSAGDKKGVASVIWPAPEPAAVVKSEADQPEPAAKTQAAADPKPSSAPKPKPSPAPEPTTEPKPASQLHKIKLEDLPDYTRSLLRIKVPVVVALADKRQPLGRIVELGAGSIIQFDKSCEEMLEMSVGGHPVATGEAVKVGDKFGLRITSIVLPDERFQPVRPQPRITNAR